MDVDDMADEDREKLEAGLLGFALVRVIHEDTPQETHAWGEVNVRESDSKHVDNILESFKAVGRQDWDHPMTVTVDEEMVDMSTIVPSPVPYSAVPVLKFKAEALSRILHFLNGYHRYEANKLLYDELVELLKVEEERLAKYKAKMAKKGANKKLNKHAALADAELEKLEKDVEKLRKRKQRVMYWMGKIFSDSKWGSGPRREFR